MKAETRRVAVVNRYAENIGRQQIAGELDTLKLQAEHRGQRMGEGGFADARNILDQQVAAGQQAGERKADLVLLAEDDLSGGVDDALKGRGGHDCVR